MPKPPTARAAAAPGGMLVVVTEDHQDVLPWLHAAMRRGVLPLRAWELWHVDAHPDLGALRDATVSLELDHAFSVPGDGSDGGRRQTAASATINLRLEEVRRTLGSVGENPVASLIPRESAYKIPGVVSGVAGVGSFDTTCAAPLLPALPCSACLTHTPICFATKPGTWTRRSASRAAAGRPW